MAATDGTADGSAYWRGVLAGTDPRINRARRSFGRLPGPSRCKVCRAPFEGIGGVVTRLFRQRSDGNPLVCAPCFGTLAQYPGGAEIDISVLFADIRGAAPPTVLQRLHRVAARAIDDNGGLVDKFLGNGVMALFIPPVAGEDHAARALAAVRDLFAAAKEEGLTETGIQLGAGLNSGLAFVGSVGDGDRLDFTALGDTVNVAAKLGAAATAGEALISLATWRRHGERFAKSRLRTVPVPGKLHPVEAVIVRADIEAAI